MLRSRRLHTDGLKISRSCSCCSCRPRSPWRSSRYPRSHSFMEISWAAAFCDRIPAGFLTIRILSSSYRTGESPSRGCRVRYAFLISSVSFESAWSSLFAENFPIVSSDKNRTTLSPASTFSLPSAFLPRRVIFFLRSILYKKEEGASGSLRCRYLSNRCPLSWGLTRNSCISASS